MENAIIPGGGSVPSIFSSDPAAVAAAETVKARIQMAYFLAVQKPRNPEEARVRILDACRRPEFADRVEFRKPVGRETICGPSVRFAEACIREWGNCLVETQVIFEDDRIRRSRVTALDLETNATYTKEIQVSKTIERRSSKNRESDILGERVNSYGKTVFILRATDDELHQKEAALISKAVRNEGLRLIPSDIVDEGMRIARETLHNRDAQDPKAATRKIIDGFRTVGVYPRALAEFMGQDLDTLAPHQIQELRGIFRSIRDGEVTWADVVDQAKEVGTQVQADDRLSELKQKAEQAKSERGWRVRPSVLLPTDDNAGGDPPSTSGPSPAGEGDAGTEAQKQPPASSTNQKQAANREGENAGTSSAKPGGHSGTAAGEGDEPPSVDLAASPGLDEPDDWALLDGNELYIAVGKTLPEDNPKLKQDYFDLVRSRDDNRLREMARDIAAKKGAQS